MEDERLDQTSDPRGFREYSPEHFPRSDGRPAPPNLASSEDGARMLAFLGAYYEINVCSARIPAPGDAGREMALDALAAARGRRDRLEDACAPIGFLAEPVMDGQFVVDVRFTTAMRAAQQPGVHRTSMTVELPDDAPGPVEGEEIETVPHGGWKS